MTIAPGETILASDILSIQQTAGAALVGGAAAHAVLIGTGATAVATALGTTGQALISNGPSADPVFSTLTASLISDFADAVAVAAPLRSVGAGLSLNSGAVGLNLGSGLAINGGSVIPVVGSGLAIVGGSIVPVLGGGLVLANGSITANGTVGSVNLTSATGLQINGTPAINIDNLNNTCVGFGAGGGTLMTGGLNTMFGWQAGVNNTSGNENTLIGYLSGQMVTTGSFLTGCGEHTLGSEIAANFSTAIGNDSQRNVISNASGANTSVGKSSQYIHGGINNTSVGFDTLHGNGCCVMLGGTATAGDVISLTVTGAFTGSPQTVSITVTNAQSLGSMATALNAAFRANSILLNLIGLGSTSGVVDTSNINLNWYQVAIPNVTVTASVSGAATETVTVLNGATGTQNVAVGSKAMQGYYWTTAHDNVAIGSNTLYSLQGGSQNIAVGLQAGHNITAGHDNILLGANAGDAITTGNFHIAVGSGALGAATTGGNNIAIGLNVGAAVTTGGSNVLIGPSVASTTLATGNNNILIGVDANTDTAAASTSNTLQIRGSGASAVPVIAASAINTATPIVALNGKLSLAAFTAATTPVAGTDIAAGFAMVWKNSGDGTVKLYYNDNATLKSVALA